MPFEMEKLAAYAGVSYTVFKNKIWEHVADLFFEIDDDLLDHEFTLEQRKKRMWEKYNYHLSRHHRRGRRERGRQKSQCIQKKN